MSEALRNFDAPIPGMSLTAELGARPWQSPAQYTTVDEAIEYYMNSMTSEDFMDQIIDVLEMGVPVASVANIMQLKSVTDGLHSVDVGVMITPLLIEMIMFLADSAGIEYETGLEDPKKGQLSGAKKAKALEELRKEVEGKESETEEEPVIEEKVEEESEPKGLMARRK
tara:strand:+ start:418 stop:924 length:507 start_codon:yes stop_codon:yes gene_type:complete